MAETHYPSHWKEKLCAMLSIGDWRNGVFSHQVMRYFEAQAIAESGRPGSGGAQWNPLNTTQAVHSDDFGNWYLDDNWNEVPVRQYKTQALGIMANAVTYLAPKYASLLDALRTADAKGTTAEQIVEQHRSEIKLWGTNPDLMSQLLKEIT